MNIVQTLGVDLFFFGSYVVVVVVAVVVVGGGGVVVDKQKSGTALIQDFLHQKYGCLSSDFETDPIWWRYGLVLL